MRFLANWCLDPLDKRSGTFGSRWRLCHNKDAYGSLKARVEPASRERERDKDNLAVRLRGSKTLCVRYALERRLENQPDQGIRHYRYERWDLIPLRTNLCDALRFCPRFQRMKLLIGFVFL